MQHASTTNLLEEQDFENIFVDTSSLLKPSFARFTEQILPVLQNGGQPLIIHQTVIDEVTKLASETETDRGLAARRALDALHALADEGHIAVDNTPALSKDVFFLTEALKERFSGKKVLIISQDSMLARDILLRVNGLQSFYGPFVNVQRLEGDGLADFDLSYSSKRPINASASAVLKKRFGL